MTRMKRRKCLPKLRWLRTNLGRSIGAWAHPAASVTRCSRNERESDNIIKVNSKKDVVKDDNKLSTRQLVHKAAKVITDPREYQLELFEIAKQMNCLAVLDTGSGKTLIACLLIRHIINEELESRRQGKHRRVSFFLVDSVTLVFQQSSVLENNIDAKVGRYYGDMCDNDKMWKPEVWEKILDKDQVIVMTADVLYLLLCRAFVGMKDINLLCFDEAHHAKKNHVYARIIKDFYEPLPTEFRPKIFGMTASPVDARVDVVEAAMDLERLLHSQIRTAEELSFVQRAAKRPNEQIIPFKPLKAPWETSLCLNLRKKYGDLHVLRKVFAFAKEATSQLGPWCADQIWESALSEKSAHKLQRKTEKATGKTFSKEAMDALEKEIALIQEAHEYISTLAFDPPQLTEEDCSSKVLLLRQVLQKIYRTRDSEKCIIFVQQRYTARCLFELLKDNVSDQFRVGILVGSRPGTTGEENFSLRQQMLNVHRFRNGKLNCLIATSVAEEGLDVPDCNWVIRFDLYTTMIQYIQSRGRARHIKSRYFHMVEEGNMDHRQLLHDVFKAEEAMRNFCKHLPEDRTISRTDIQELEEQADEPYYLEEETGAKLTLTSALQVISTFASNLDHNGEDEGQPIYVVKPATGRRFVCQLILPSTSPINGIECLPQPSKAGAKRLVAFEACLRLRAGKHLNGHFLPKIRRKELPKFANARLAVDANRSNTYTFRRKPSFWDVNDPTPPTKLWVTIILVQDPKHFCDMQYICIATREPLPRMPPFKVYGAKGEPTQVQFLRLKEPLNLDEEKLEILNSFLDRIFFDVFNKHFEISYETTRYWLAPVLGQEFDENMSASDLIDWETLKFVAAHRDLPFEPGDDPTVAEERFLIDRVDRSRRFISHGWVQGIGPSDKVLEGTSGAGVFANILDYSYNAGKKRRWMQVKWDIPETEPVYSAERLLHRLNFLDPPTERELELSVGALICPSAFSISRIPVRLVHALMLFPSVSTRMDAFLHAWELSKILGLGDLDLSLALEAITKDSDNTDLPLEKQINKQRGMGNNYERLEFLGDCYLKLGTSISLFCRSHSDSEFQLHVERMIMVCNQNLFQKARKIGIPDYIQTQGFSRRTWYPHMKLLHGKKTGVEAIKTNLHTLGDKSVADVCEALIGAALFDKGLDGATKMVSSILGSEHHSQQCFADYYKGYVKPGYQLAQPTASQQKLADDIEAQFGYRFKSPTLLMSAFTHPSNPWPWEKVPSYQRLEFLGDALLDLACVEFIFKKYPEADPQWLTEHKMAMVSNRFLGAVSVILGFHKKIRKVGAHLDAAIAEYVTNILQAKEKSDAPNFWADLSIMVPPKTLPDVLEAFIGAMFVDSEFKYSLIEGFFDVHIRPYFVDMSLYDDFAGQHPSTFLAKKLDNIGCQQWGWETTTKRTDEDGLKVFTAVVIHGEIFSVGTGASAKAARIIAAEAALEKLNSFSPEEVRNLCNCPKSTDKEEAKGDE
ncbi:hypothetical protein FN846DRAFT_21763 [Sphaerosporella brunnea]|uniref:Dicer-like protein 1 n=1 Tax=Sphaerosporella brunnea TaxID=1250544 RepID=A0A5J5EVB7_9PEZI|nr:hypothetical protein FN846DRAFT_21763 [Sphaerosporella brunnea]